MCIRDRNTFIPRFKKTESIKFFVSGGPGKQSQIWVPFPQVFKPVSKKIAESPSTLKHSRIFPPKDPAVPYSPRCPHETKNLMDSVFLKRRMKVFSS